MAFRTNNFLVIFFSAFFQWCRLVKNGDNVASLYFSAQIGLKRPYTLAVILRVIFPT